MTRRNLRLHTRNAFRLASFGIGLITVSCTSTSTPCTGDPAADLTHQDPGCRSNAAVLAAEGGRLDLFPGLLANLRDQQGDVRLITGVAARKLSGLDVDFRPFASTNEQEAAIARWQSWWARNHGLTERGDAGPRDPVVEIEEKRSDAHRPAIPPDSESPAGASPTTSE